MSKPTTNRRRTRTMPTIQPVRIDEWKEKHGINDFPGGITPCTMQGATVYFFPPKTYCGHVKGERIIAHPTTNWPEENIFAGDHITIQAGPVSVGEIILLDYAGDDVLCKLLSRDAWGNIQVFDSAGETTYLRKGEAEIIGRAIDFLGKDYDPKDCK